MGELVGDDVLGHEEIMELHLVAPGPARVRCASDVSVRDDLAIVVVEGVPADLVVVVEVGLARVPPERADLGIARVRGDQTVLVARLVVGRREVEAAGGRDRLAVGVLEVGVVVVESVAGLGERVLERDRGRVRVHEQLHGIATAERHAPYEPRRRRFAERSRIKEQRCRLAEHGCSRATERAARRVLGRRRRDRWNRVQLVETHARGQQPTRGKADPRLFTEWRHRHADRHAAAEDRDPAKALPEEHDVLLVRVRRDGLERELRIGLVEERAPIREEAPRGGDRRRAGDRDVELEQARRAFAPMRLDRHGRGRAQFRERRRLRLDELCVGRDGDDDPDADRDERRKGRDRCSLDRGNGSSLHACTAMRVSLARRDYHWRAGRSALMLPPAAPAAHRAQCSPTLGRAAHGHFFWRATPGRKSQRKIRMTCPLPRLPCTARTRRCAG